MSQNFEFFRFDRVRLNQAQFGLKTVPLANPYELEFFGEVRSYFGGESAFSHLLLEASLLCEDESLEMNFFMKNPFFVKIVVVGCGLFVFNF